MARKSLKATGGCDVYTDKDVSDCFNYLSTENKKVILTIMESMLIAQYGDVKRKENKASVREDQSPFVMLGKRTKQGVGRKKVI